MSVTCTFDDFCSALDDEVTYPTEFIRIVCLHFSWNYYRQCEEKWSLSDMIKNEQINVSNGTKKMREMYGID